MSRGAISLFHETVRLSRRIAELRDALEMTLTSAHDAGRVASGGKLHPTESVADCPSMVCQDVQSLLIPSTKEET